MINPQDPQTTVRFPVPLVRSPPDDSRARSRCTGIATDVWRPRPLASPPSEARGNTGRVRLAALGALWTRSLVAAPRAKSVRHPRRLGSVT